MTGIYRIVNKINNKYYIGQSRDIDFRISNHFEALRNDSHRNQSGMRDKLQNAWNKYGEDNFYWEVLEECSIDILNEREKYWIEYYNSFLDGYNQTKGGEGGDTFTYRSDKEKELTKSKRLAKMTGRIIINNGTETKRVYEDDFIRLYEPDGWKRGMSSSYKESLKANHKGFTGLRKTPEHNEKMSKRFKGIPLSDEHRRKLSESHKGYIMPESQRRKIGDKTRGKIYVNNGKVSKLLSKDEVEDFLKNNKDYSIGRKRRNGKS